MKPLFLSLKTEYYEAFANGTKTHEMRRYGRGRSQYNEDNCPIGRAVTLSKGYGKKHRMQGEVVSFEKRHGSTFGHADQAAILDVYGTLDVLIADIGIRKDFGLDS